MARELLDRRGVDENHTWDLAVIFETEEEFEKVLKEAQRLAGELAEEFEGKLNTTSLIIRCLDRLRGLYEMITAVSTYADLEVSVDQTDKQKRHYQLYQTP